MRVIDGLFDEYATLSEASSEYLGRSTPKPASMQESAYKRTIRARAFDIARYLLPLATNTSVGQIVSARTLENQISRLAGDSHPEVRDIARLLKESATAAPYNLRVERLERLLGELRERHPEVDGSELAGLLSNPPVAPTLVKYAEAKPHEEARAVELTEMAASLLRNAELEPSDSVTLVRPTTLEIEVAATLLYEHSHHSYRQIVDIVSDLSSRTRQEIIALGVKYRGPFDEVSRSYAAGQGFQFDLLMDIGGLETCIGIVDVSRFSSGTLPCTVTLFRNKWRQSDVPPVSRSRMDECRSCGRRSVKAKNRRSVRAGTTSCHLRFGGGRSSRWTWPKLSTFAS